MWQDKEEEGGWRFELSECPVSVLCRNDLALKMLRDWNALEQPPLDFTKVPISLWLKVRALKEEQVWRSNQLSPEDKGDDA